MDTQCKMVRELLSIKTHSQLLVKETSGRLGNSFVIIFFSMQLFRHIQQGFNELTVNMISFSTSGKGWISGSFIWRAQESYDSTFILCNFIRKEIISSLASGGPWLCLAYILCLYVSLLIWPVCDFLYLMSCFMTKSTLMFSKSNKAVSLRSRNGDRCCSGNACAWPADGSSWLYKVVISLVNCQRGFSRRGLIKYVLTCKNRWLLRLDRQVIRKRCLWKIVTK